MPYGSHLGSILSLNPGKGKITSILGLFTSVKVDTSLGEGLNLMWRVSGADWFISLVIITWSQLDPALFQPRSTGENKTTFETQHLQV